jgi:hypothetical protein
MILYMIKLFFKLADDGNDTVNTKSILSNISDHVEQKSDDQ